jgi:uncharacterized membrane protein
VRRHADLLFAIALAVCGALASLLAEGIAPLRIAFAAPLVLVLPGFALTRLLFSERAIGIAERLLLTVGLSLGCAAVGGVILNLVPSGLNVGSWAVLLCLITLVGCAATIARERDVVSDVEDVQRQQDVTRIAPVQAACVAAAFVIAGAGLWVAHLPAPQQPQQGYTLLWSLPNSSTPGDTTVRVGVRNMEPDPTQYTLRIMSASSVLQEFAITLQPVDEWQADINLPSGTTDPVEAVLYRGSDTQNVYRRTMLRTGA